MMGTVIVGLAVLALAGNAVHCLWKDKKSGKNCAGCGGGCEKCGAKKGSV